MLSPACARTVRSGARSSGSVVVKTRYATIPDQNERIVVARTMMGSWSKLMLALPYWGKYRFLFGFFNAKPRRSTFERIGVTRILSNVANCFVKIRLLVCNNKQWLYLFDYFWLNFSLVFLIFRTSKFWKLHV